MNEKDRIERELGNLLSVDPSPGFEDRVRAHVFQQPKMRASNFRWVLAAAVPTVIVAAVLIFQPQRVSKPEVAVTVSRSIVPPPNLAVETLPKPASTAARQSATKKSEPQLVLAANEVRAMRRLFSGEIKELPVPFEPEVREFRTLETDIEPLPPPPAVTIDPIEPLPLAGQ